MDKLTIAEALRQGVDLHKRGELDDAERLYRQVLEADARNGDAWHLLGLVAHARGNAEVAVDHISRAIQIDPRQPSFHNHLAEVYRGQARLAEAEQSCRTALALKEDFALAHNTLGLVLSQQGRVEDAADCFRRSVALDPTLAMAHCNLGQALRDLGQTIEAVPCYLRALQCDPGMAEAHFQFGSLLQSEGNIEPSIQCFQNAVRYQPDHALAHYNLGLLYKAQGDLDRAAECYIRALQIRPRFAEALNNLGNLLKDQGRIVEARANYEQSLKFDPDNAAADYNLGVLLQGQGQTDPAMQCFERALQIQPDYVDAHYARGHLLLAQGHYPDGWLEYEWRLRSGGLSKHTFDRPRWQGEAIDGRTLLVYAEQGLGDTIQFVRYLPLLAQRGGTILFGAQGALIGLLNQSGLGEIVNPFPMREPLPSFDLYVPLGSLPGILGTTLDNIPAAGGYLSADPQLVDHWRGVLGDAPPRKVGIAWQGSPTYLGDRFRSIPLEQFAPLAIEGVELVSLQKGFGAEQMANLGKRFQVRDLGSDFDEAHGAFMDTAAVMKNLDLVVTSDTATAHLAGALGVEVWVALPLVPDWRWMFARSDSPWYASMRLFRQTRLDDWTSVFIEIAAALRQFTSAR